MTVPDVRGQLVVAIPAWNALYQIRDFAQYVQNVHARGPGSRPLALRKLDKQTWEISGNGTLTVEYDMTWDEPGPFSAQFNENHAFLNLALLLFYVPDRRSEDVRIEFTEVPLGWEAASALKPDKSSFTFTAANYDALVDAPVELGSFEESSFEIAGRRVRVVTHGDPGDRKALQETLRRIVSYQVELMREAPFPEYLFLYHFGLGGGGGMEHANSTAISVPAAVLPANVSAHEFFHLWNVKRIRPQSLEPVDYSREMWTRALWFAEGVTSTYGSYTLVRTGLWSPRQFYDDLANQMRSLGTRSARQWHSAEESSLDAWLEKYPAHNRGTSSVNYYNKGQLVGILLDILLRDASQNRCSLDDVLRYLNEQYAHRGRFYEDSVGIRLAAREVLARSLAKTGLKSPSNPAPILDEFFAKYVAGVEEVPFRDYLLRAGLLLKPLEKERADLGFSIAQGTGTEPSVFRLQAGSGAEKAGLRDGDILAQWAGADPPRNLEAWARNHQPGEAVAVRVRRAGQGMDFRIILGRREERSFEIEEDKNASELARRIRQGILSGKTDP